MRQPRTYSIQTGFSRGKGLNEGASRWKGDPIPGVGVGERVMMQWRTYGILSPRHTTVPCDWTLSHTALRHRTIGQEGRQQCHKFGIDTKTHSPPVGQFLHGCGMGAKTLKGQSSSVCQLGRGVVLAARHHLKATQRPMRDCCTGSPRPAFFLDWAIAGEPSIPGSAVITLKSSRDLSSNPKHCRTSLLLKELIWVICL